MAATIWLIGDSTVEDNRAPFRGWGWALPGFVSAGVTVRNHAMSGCSSRSFRDEGRFVPVEAGMQPGDLLLIQFGHNDEKDAPALHTDPDTSYREQLARFCDAALRKGAQPVLVTPVSRRWFIPGGEMLYTHGEYPSAMRSLAAERGIPLIDLKSASRALYLSLGEAGTAALFVRLAPGEHPDFPQGHDDKTHFNAQGARQIAALVAQGVADDPRTAQYVNI